MSEARTGQAEEAAGAGEERVRSAREILEEKLSSSKTEVPAAEQALKAAADREPSEPGRTVEAGARAVKPGDEAKRAADHLKEREALRSEVLLARADLDNYQKRIRREMEEVRTYAAQGVLSDVLSALDNVDFSIAAAKLKPDFEQLLLGVEMVRTQLEKVLADRGAVRVPTDKVPFDPRRHEAILTEDRADLPDNTVVQELRRGYAMKDRVIRAAQVRVSRSSAKADPVDAGNPLKAGV